MLFLRNADTNTLEIYVVTLGIQDITKFFHQSIQKTNLEYKNVKSFSVSPYNMVDGQETILLNILEYGKVFQTNWYEIKLSADPS